ncbi:MAG: hypothetical protein R3325_10210 [Thermoanaerobaculia bacterium]|nr:hypothetical protein [Thermoanaerobaculia bacterium]
MVAQPPESVLLVHAAATRAMTGIIWFVQWVHYPLFPFARGPRFEEFARRHQSRTGAVVGPLMLVEAASALWIALAGGGPLAWTGLALVAVIWLSTAAAQMPRHRALERGYDEAQLRRLLRGNWVRTAAWTGRSLVALTLLAG